MATLYNQIFNILTTSPGNLVYHLVLAFAVAGTLLSALSNWRQSEFPQGQRLVIGLSLLLVVRVDLFLGAGFVWQWITPSQSLLPILDRVTTMLGIIIIVWLWCFPEPLKKADIASLFIGIVTIMLAVFNYMWGRTQIPGTLYNGTGFNIIWAGIALFVLILGGGLALIRRPNGWGYAIAMLGCLAGGQILHLIIPSTESDFPGMVRLAQMAAYPLLFALPQRFAPTERPTSAAPSQQTPPLIHKRRHYNVESHILEGIFSISPESTWEELQLNITRLSSQILLADLSLLISLPSGKGNIDILCGHDLIREEALGSISISSSQLPLLSTALHRGKALRLPASSTSQDYLNLSKLLRLGRIGHLLAVPLILPQKERKYGLILLSPYSKRSWSKEDQNYILRFTEAIQKTLSYETKTPELRTQLAHTCQMLEGIKKELDETTKHNKILQNKNTSLQEQVATLKDNSQELNKLQGALEKAHAIIANLEAEKIKFETQLNRMNEQALLLPDEQLEQELTLALEEIARLRIRLAEVDQENNDIRSQSKEIGMLSDTQVKSIAILTQELRHPLSSMVGYADILLGESVGVLGSLQRQFLDRIVASIERIRMLLNAVIEEAAIDIDELSLNSSEVSLSKAIDRTISEVSNQIREKRISIRVDLPSKLPKLHIDEDILHQIFLTLLKNASSVTRPEGEILIRARDYDELSEHNLSLVQVADQGGGISIDDLPRVFSRLNNNATIAGIGDQGADLSIVKTLVEAQQGRIWVDSKKGIGATFSLLLPLAIGKMDER